MEAHDEEGGARRRWLVDVSRWLPTPSQFQSTAALLPAHDLPAISRFVREEDRKRALVSRLLQRSLVRRALGVPSHQVAIRRTLEGKPYLLPLQDGTSVVLPRFNFNASHQGGYVGIASEPLCLVGLDIVCVSKPRGETVAEFIGNFTEYLTGHEWSRIVNAGRPDEMLTEFYRYWCLKEAFVKAIGAGVGFGLQRLEFHHVDWTNISVHIDGEESRKWRFWLFKLDDTHLASIAKGHPEDAVSSYKRTFPDVVVDDQEFHAALEIPEETFTSLTVGQLIQLQD